VDVGVRGRYPCGTKTVIGERTKRLLERGGEAKTLEIHGERSPQTNGTLVEAHARRVSRSSGEDGDPDCGKRAQQPFFGPGSGPATESSTDAGGQLRRRNSDMKSTSASTASCPTAL